MTKESPSLDNVFSRYSSTSPLEFAKLLLTHDITPIPVEYKVKKPASRDWNTSEYLADIRCNPVKYFNGKPLNMGAALGAESGGLADGDLDCQEAAKAAPYLLPATGWVHGREGKPQSHWMYRVGVTESGLSAVFKDPLDNSMLLELRHATREQKPYLTVIPPSIHPDGWTYRFDQAGLPAPVSAHELQSAMAALASAVALSRRWPKSGRQDLVLALAGGLLRAGRDEQFVRRFVKAIISSAADEDEKDRQKRLDAVRCTSEKLKAQAKASGWPTVAEILGKESEAILRRIHKWLGISTKPSKLQPGGEPTKRQPGLGTKPRIVTTDVQLGEMSNQAKSFLEDANNPAVLFLKAGQIVRVATEANGTARFMIVDEDQMRRRLTEVLDFVRNDFKAAMPPAVFAAKSQVQYT